MFPDPKGRLGKLGVGDVKPGPAEGLRRFRLSQCIRAMPTGLRGSPTSIIGAAH
jgi:hypothetical protein